MKWIVGIGNPGTEYANTRHNLGFRVVDWLAHEMAPKGKWKVSRSLKAEILEIDSVTLVKPMTFVNRSGETVEALVHKHRLKSEALLVIADDVNLAFGKMRLRPSGSAGGHHGLESIIQCLGQDSFARLRMGVKNSQMPSDLSGFVLQPFSPIEKKKLPEWLKNACEVARCWNERGVNEAIQYLGRLGATSNSGSGESDKEQ